MRNDQWSRSVREQKCALPGSPMEHRATTEAGRLNPRYEALPRTALPGGSASSVSLPSNAGQEAEPQCSAFQGRAPEREGASGLVA